jgi:hypothetical protein
VKISEGADVHTSLSALGLFVSLHGVFFSPSSSPVDAEEEIVSFKPQGNGKGKGGKRGGVVRESEDVIDQFISTMENIIKLIPSTSRRYVLLSLLLSTYVPSSSSSYPLVQSVVSARLLRSQLFTTILPAIVQLKDGTKNPHRVDSIFASLIMLVVSSSFSELSASTLSEKEQDQVFKTISVPVLNSSSAFHLTPFMSPVPLADGMLQACFIITLLSSPSFETYLYRVGAFLAPSPLVCFFIMCQIVIFAYLYGCFYQNK